MHPACNPHRRCQNSVQTTRTGGADAGKSACTSVQGAARCKEMPLHLGAGAGRPELNRLNARCDLALCVALEVVNSALRSHIRARHVAGNRRRLERGKRRWRRGGGRLDLGPKMRIRAYGHHCGQSQCGCEQVNRDLDARHCEWRLGCVRLRLVGRT